VVFADGIPQKLLRRRDRRIEGAAGGEEVVVLGGERGEEAEAEEEMSPQRDAEDTQRDTEEGKARDQVKKSGTKTGDHNTIDLRKGG
jgi:hypothetical protein